MTWAIALIGDFVDAGSVTIQTGPFGTQLKAADYVSEGTPVINVRNIGYGDLRPDKIEYVPETTKERLSVHLLRPNDIVFGRKGAVDRHLFITENHFAWMQGSDCIRLRIESDELNPRFVSYAFLRETHKKWMLTQSSNKATMASLNQDIIRRIPIPLPARAIQDDIVKILSAYDELIENNRRRIQLLEESARLLYREWFVHLRFPGHEHVKLVDGVPEGWSYSTIGDVAEYVNRGIAPIYDDDGEFTVINQKCIRNRLLTLALARTQTKEYKEEKAIKKYDVLINSTGTGTLGRVAQCWQELDKTSVDTHVTIVRPSKKIAPLWFGYALLELEKVFEDMGEGATNQKELKRARVSDLKIKVPSKGLMEEFDKVVDSVTLQIINLNEQNHKLAEARDLLLPRLMNGDIAV